LRLHFCSQSRQNPQQSQPIAKNPASANPAGFPPRVDCAAMTRPHPDLWYPIAALLSALRKLLRAAAPEAYSCIALEARACWPR
jgi:hypothetical protein